MQYKGPYNPSFPLDKCGIKNGQTVHYNLTDAELYEMALLRNEGKISAQGAFSVTTGKHTGRCASDKFIVSDPVTENAIWWENNQKMEQQHFDTLKQDFFACAEQKKFLFVQDLFAGADPEYSISVRVVTEYAWHALFIRHLLRRPTLEQIVRFKPELTVIDLPSFSASPELHGCHKQEVIAVNFSQKLVLIGSTEYGGEIKKSVFTTLNYLLPERGVLPMHCSANFTNADQSTALFFGLSGTGKTTLSSDPERILVGDDEHGWSSHGVFNFEGGCYAKTYRLSVKSEPEIYGATQRWGTLLENVVLDDYTRQPDFSDDSLTENGRAAYQLDAIPNASSTGQAGHPKQVIMLTADSFGVMPPLARLSPEQAMYHFLSGYTSKVAGTELGVVGVEATFSTCFGSPFMPRHPSTYGNLLRSQIVKHNAECWLLNTGWTGGAYGVGHRISIEVTRSLLRAIFRGDLDDTEMVLDPFFGFSVPKTVPDVDSLLLNPRNTWQNSQDYDIQAQRLITSFQENFRRFEDYVDEKVMAVALGRKKKSDLVEPC